MPTAPRPPTAESPQASLLGLLVAAPAPSLGILAGLHLWPGPLGNALYLAGKGLLYVTPLLWWLWVMRRPFPLRRPPPGTLREGLLVGLPLAAVIVGAFLVVAPGVDAGPLRAAAAKGGFDTPGVYALMAVGICLLNALLEEYAFRWFLYGRCRSLLGRAPGAVLGALIFTAHHVLVLVAYFDLPLVLLGTLGVFAGGLVWTWLYERRDSVWPAYVSHVVVDVALLSIGAWLLFA